ncbi:MAG: hypothetical protein MJD61_16405 [Proteobacteria bacterium]|nr:hypothetical protein [Pseudomonadota bacterium]
MSLRRVSRIRGSSLLVLLALCAEGCVLFASTADYDDYRLVRLAGGEDERLLAMRDYLERQPSGWWQGSVRRELATREAAFYETHRDDRSGVERYLRVYPNGTFAGRARARLRVLDGIGRRRNAEEQLRRAEQHDKAAQDSELHRTWLSRWTSKWMQRLLGIVNWGSPLPDVAARNPGFSEAYGSTPVPRCSPFRCTKRQALDYWIPVPGATRIERRLEAVVRLGLRDGRLVQAELLLPGFGFSRWYELEQRRNVVDELPDARREACDWALGRLDTLLQAQALRPVKHYPGTLELTAGRAARAARAGSSTPPPDGSPDPLAPADDPEVMLLDPVEIQSEPAAPPSERARPPGPPAPTIQVLRAYARGRVSAHVFAASEPGSHEAYDGVLVRWGKPADRRR